MGVSCGPSPNACRIQTPAAKIPAATRPVREEGSFERIEIRFILERALDTEKSDQHLIKADSSRQQTSCPPCIGLIASKARCVRFLTR